MQKSKTGKYFKYAIGEIILVVIGILIALQINNWNNERLNKLDADVAKENLHNEFIKNQNILKTSKEHNQYALEACLSLINLIGATKKELAQQNLDSLFNSSLKAEFYFPTRSSLDNILQTGSMKLIESEELKNTLQTWIASLEQMKSYKEVQTNWQNNQYTPFLLNTVSFRQMDIYNQTAWSGKSKISTDYYSIFQSIQLENLLDNNLFLIELTISQLTGLETLQHTIIDLTGKSL
ncbi:MULTISPECIES: DUF6090 family protein [unclassified Polaribacter]|uniref:DUF6090 family protein n=1 Tax=unclassified Polaribacter TaxID=196858 RepID=UPI0016741E83|nr:MULTISPECIES: DUF6090 family protein [unclassified Polaribacter]